MNAKTFFRTLGFLLILFLVIYVSTQNMQAANFNFPSLLDKPVRAPAAYVFFAMFAVGVVGGTLLNGGNAGGASAPAKGKK